MRRAYKAIASKAIASACTMLVVTSHAWAAGLHFTKEEVAIWRTRKNVGPYKDDWNAILNRANTFKSSPGSTWAGNTSGTCQERERQKPNRSFDAEMRDAALVYLLTGDTSYFNPVRTKLLAQVKTSGTNFANTSLWCRTDWQVAGAQDFNSWLRRLAYTYDYIKHGLSASDRTAIENWLLAGGQYTEAAINNLVSKTFPGRLNDNYTCVGGGCPGSQTGITHFGGFATYQIQTIWRSSTMNAGATVSAIAHITNNALLKARMKRLFKEWVHYVMFPGGLLREQARWNSPASLQQGYHYTTSSIGAAITIADIFARGGDTELFDYETSTGITLGAFSTVGGPKGLRVAARHIAGLTTKSITNYASSTATTNPDLRITWNMPTELTGLHPHIGFVNLIWSNIYYNDPLIKKAYMTPLPSRWSTGGFDMLSGDQGTFPRVRLMFAEMEGNVWPYPTIKDTTPPAAPVGLRITPGGQ